MITKDNRTRVVTMAQRLLSNAERFSAFSAAGAHDTLPGHEELKVWADFMARDFDEEFNNLAALLGYSVEKIKEQADA
jgi:hypothetical protein